jgi:hypothetical protein
MGSRGNASHIVTYDKKAASSQRVLVAFATTKPSQRHNLRQKAVSSQRVLANLGVCQITKGANATQ